MVDFKKLSDRAKDLVDKRGGTDGLKRDADKLKNIATGKGSLSDKAKAAAQALKETPREQAASGSAKRPRRRSLPRRPAGRRPALRRRPALARHPAARRSPPRSSPERVTLGGGPP
jgi:hypothetical protein